MSISTVSLPRPTALPWWMWCKFLGWPLLALALAYPHPFLLVLAAHWLTDFTLQGHQTSIGKARRDLWTTCYHAWISGGYAGFIAGGLPGLAISVLIHFLIDWLYKPVYGDSPATRILDQLFHLVTLFTIWSLSCGA